MSTACSTDYRKMLLVLLIVIFLFPQGINSSHPDKMSERTVVRQYLWQRSRL
ncbi:hypothetical protein [Nostoc sp.]|uniref:hypothetical protein n=1 Tax=Nostoc sp. TaxID=1180 RepID=UPI002FF943DA